MNRYEVEIEEYVRSAWANRSDHTIDGFLTMVVDAVRSLDSREPGYADQKFEAAKRYTLRNLFLLVPVGGDLAAAEQLSVDRLKEVLLAAPS